MADLRCDTWLQAVEKPIRLTGPVSVGDADCPYLRSVSAVLPAVIRPNARGGHPIIAFIKDGAEIRKILEHIGVDPTPPKIAPARGPPLWDGCDVDVEEYVADPDAWNYMDQRTPDSGPQIDQSIGWRGGVSG